ncbi:MAG: TIGR04282 family arsenosugar biosynthesis glycosyltransferase [Spirochaetota bacterium]
MRVARVLFARVPERGAVKTRLAADFDEAAAYAIYRWLLRIQNRLFTSTPPAGHRYTDYVFYAPRVNRVTARWRFAPDLSGVSLRLRPQEEGDLGQRLAAATAEVLKHNELALIWGADIPALPPSAFEQAIALYPQSVITLARDGGYAFLSIARDHFSREIFSGIRWSTHHTGRDQLRALLRAKVPVTVSGKVADLDRAKDFTRIIRELEHFGRGADLEDLSSTLQSISAL